MMRTRLVWFTIGFSSAAAVMTQFVFRDLWSDRHSLSSQLKEKFDALETRVSNLEPVISTDSTSHEDERNLN